MSNQDKELGHQAHSKKAEELGILDQVARPLKVVFLGAGSGFFKPLFIDILSIPGADRGEMAIVDIDETRLELAKQLAEKIIVLSGKDWTVTATTERKSVLKGADYIINCIEVSGVDCVRHDNDIPKKYGVDQCIGDTIGPGGLFKALRTVPVWLEVLKDVEELCPDAWCLNYTNPMSIMCLASHRASAANVVGLCHSVQGTSRLMADYAKVPYPEMKWECAGINHLAWFTTLTHNGQDLYPVIRKNLEEDPEMLARDPVRLDMMKYFDYFVTESSGHFSEYLPYYRKRQDLIDKHCGDGYKGGSSFYADNWPDWRKKQDEYRQKVVNGEEELKIERTYEYASFIIEAMETNNAFVIHGSVPNQGLITNLPQDGVVEVACLVNKNGITPTHFGKLPPQCAAVCDWNMRMFDLAATACIEKSKEAAIHAMLVDPLTAAVCSPEEIKRMTLELFEAEKQFLSGF